MNQATYSLYIVRCRDDSYYTGIATDVGRRLREHEQGRRGAKYLSGRGPLRLVFTVAVGDRSSASQLEYQVKKLTRAKKQLLIDGKLSLSDIRRDQDSLSGSS